MEHTYPRENSEGPNIICPHVRSLLIFWGDLRSHPQDRVPGASLGWDCIVVAEDLQSICAILACSETLCVSVCGY